MNGWLGRDILRCEAYSGDPQSCMPFWLKIGGSLISFFPPTTTLDTLCGYYRVGLGIARLFFSVEKRESSQRAEVPRPHPLLVLNSSVENTGKDSRG